MTLLEQIPCYVTLLFPRRDKKVQAEAKWLQKIIPEGAECIRFETLWRFGLEKLNEMERVLIMRG